MKGFHYQTKDIRDSLRLYLREIGLETPLLEHRIMYAWTDIAGENVSKFTQNTFVKNGVLFVKISNAALRHDLQMGHNDLTRRLNEKVGAQVITDVKFL
ncbi:MAG: DUF721 domain-containing protein [Bacteroidaceae bacterium]|nr:DUF721 domain-containing protein [Bacteroidaceae bacterium]